MQCIQNNRTFETNATFHSNGTFHFIFVGVKSYNTDLYRHLHFLDLERRVSCKWGGTQSSTKKDSFPSTSLDNESAERCNAMFLMDDLSLTERDSFRRVMCLSVCVNLHLLFMCS